MSTVVAAIDNSAAADPVLRTALAVAHLTGAEVVSIHVVETDARNARTAASFCGVPPHELTGDVVEQLVAAASQADVELLVVGARGRRLGARPAGHVTLELMTLVAKPLVLVPSQARVPDRIGRLLELDRRSPVGARGGHGLADHDLGGAAAHEAPARPEDRAGAADRDRHDRDAGRGGGHERAHVEWAQAGDPRQATLGEEDERATGPGGLDEACRVRGPVFAVGMFDELDRARVLLGMGERVVLGATFHDPSWRAAAAQLADEAVADLTELRCVAPVEVAVARAARRLGEGADVSDAHEAVVRAMAASEVPWPAATTIDSNGAPDAAISAAVAAVERGA